MCSFPSPALLAALGLPTPMAGVGGSPGCGTGWCRGLCPPGLEMSSPGPGCWKTPVLVQGAAGQAQGRGLLPPFAESNEEGLISPETSWSSVRT